MSQSDDSVKIPPHTAVEDVNVSGSIRTYPYVRCKLMKLSSVQSSVAVMQSALKSDEISLVRQCFSWIVCDSNSSILLHFKIKYFFLSKMKDFYWLRCKSTEDHCSLLWQCSDFSLLGFSVRKSGYTGSMETASAPPS